VPDDSAKQKASQAGFQNVSIRFKAKLGRDDFACGMAVSGIGRTNATVQPADFRLFIHDLKLINAQAEAVRVVIDNRVPWQSNDVALLDFENGKDACTQGDPAMNWQVTGQVPTGSYHAVEFSNGVPEALEYANPVWLSPPLGLSLLTKGGLTGYHFIKLELVATPTLASDADMGEGVLLLSSSGCGAGLDDAGIGCVKPNRNRVRLDGYALGSSVIAVHADAVFAGSDLSVGVVCEGRGSNCQSMFESVGVDFEAGTPRLGQTLYTLE
jgi:uncharacterized repeat protein (TIGR04052 family)